MERIVEMLGVPPPWMIEAGKTATNFFELCVDEHGRRRWKLKSREKYAMEMGKNEKPGKKYFSSTSLTDLVKTYPWPRKEMKREEIEKGKEIFDVKSC